MRRLHHVSVGVGTHIQITMMDKWVSDAAIIANVTIGIQIRKSLKLRMMQAMACAMMLLSFINTLKEYTFVKKTI